MTEITTRLLGQRLMQRDPVYWDEGKSGVGEREGRPGVTRGG